MDSAIKTGRKYPSYTTAQLKEALPHASLAQYQSIKEEIERREAGLSVPFKTPQVSWK